MVRHRLPGQSVSMVMMMGMMVVVLLRLMYGGRGGCRLMVMGSMMGGRCRPMETGVVVAPWRHNGASCRPMDEVHLSLATIAGEENRLGRHDLSHLRLRGMHVMGGCCCCGGGGCGGSGSANGGHVNGRDSVVFKRLEHVVRSLRVL